MIGTTWLAFAPMFYSGYAIASLVRDSVLVRFSSEKQRIIYLRGKKWRQHIWRLVRGQDDLSEASNRDFVAANLLRSAITDIKGWLALAGVIFSIVYYILFGFQSLQAYIEEIR
jgi:hypothetical protein